MASPTVKGAETLLFKLAAMCLFLFVAQGVTVGFRSAQPYAFLAGAVAYLAVGLWARARPTVSE